METLESLLLSIPWFAWIAIIALIGQTVSAAIRMSHEHDERMESIRLGMAVERRPYDSES
ncbi:MAG: hypothetical protein ACI9F9_000565 [Candidatus Paceibacteria bacterium]|jgi:hypothetical protein